MSSFRTFGDIPHSHYPVIMADPPWTFLTRSSRGKGRSAERHYGCMSIADIKALPVAQIATKNSTFLLWVPDPHLAIGMEVMAALGFTYKTVGLYWVKRNKNALPLNIVYDRCYVPTWADHQFFTGMGYWTRANPEMCLLGTRGAPKRTHKDVRKLIVSKRREHSRKPDEQYTRIERLVKGPYLELFARTAAPGWDAWGNQTGTFDVN
jgi:N6-adenosine-specific RNA methylase IME4